MLLLRATRNRVRTITPAHLRFTDSVTNTVL